MKKTRLNRTLGILIALIAALALTGCAAAPTAAPAAPAEAAAPAAAAPAEAPAEEPAARPIKIAVIAPMEGGGAMFGLKTQQGVDLFVEKANAAGGINGGTVEVVYLDDKGDATESTNAYNKIAEEVDMIIGPVYSSCAIAVAPLAEEDGKICVTPAATNPAVTLAGKTMFRASFKDDDYGTAMADFAADKLNLTKYACLYNSSDDYSVGLADAFIKQAGDKLVISEAYGANDVDFKTQLTKIKAAGVDAIFLPGMYSFTAPILMQMKELDMLSIQVLAADAYGIIGALSDPSVAEGLVVCDGFPTDSEKPQIKEFVTEFQAKYNEMPDQFAALGYDAMTICAQALTNAKSYAPEDLLDAMFAVEADGITGQLAFAEDGSQKYMNFLFQYVEDGQLITYQD